MTKVIDIDERGVLTLPKELMEKLGIEPGGRILLEETPEGVFLRSNMTFPIEMYSEDRLAEFAKNNEDALAALRLKE
jgi:AbrB family looped-hinge helix DNA binding protein